VPASGDEEGLGVEGLRVEVVRPAFGEGARRGDVRLGVTVIRAAGLGGLEVGALAGRDGELQAGVDGGAGSLHVIRGLAVHIDVRAGGEGDAPVRHRGGGVELGGLAEGAEGLVAIEPIHLVQPLVEEALGLGGFGRDGVLPDARAGQEGSGLLLREEEEKEESVHGR